MTKLVFVADLHVGHRVGLTLPRVTLEGGAHVDASREQAALYERYRACTEGPWHRPDYLVCAGDPFDGQGRKGGGVEQWTTDVGTQCRVAADLLRMWQPRKGFIILRGSDYHGALNGVPADEWLARELQALPTTNEERPAEDGQDLQRSHQVANIVADGVTIQVAHATGFTGVWNYRSTAITRDMLMAKVRDRMRQQLTAFPQTRVLYRAHVHFTWHVESLHTHGFVIPCWQGPTWYMLKKSASAEPEVGFWSLEVHDGKIVSYDKQAWAWSEIVTPRVIALGAEPRGPARKSTAKRPLRASGSRTGKHRRNPTKTRTGTLAKAAR